MLNNFISEVGASLLRNEREMLEGQGNHHVSNKEPPKTISMPDIDPGIDGYREFIAKGNSGYLFEGSVGYNKMVGGESLNWFLIKEDWQLADWDFATPQNIVIGGPGYNVLDFSGVQQDVHAVLGGNDYVNQRIENLNAEFNPSYPSFWMSKWRGA